MKIVIISDTHNQHEDLGKLSGDVLIHCGDMFDLFNNDDTDLHRIDEWFGQQNFDLILCTGGNHDLSLEARIQTTQNPFENAVYLQDRTYTHKGIVFYGAPWIPQLKGHAFFQSASELHEKWSMIPPNTHVLITHTPPCGILDRSSLGWQLGCDSLAAAVDRIAPRLHCFGHVHASAGVLESDQTTFVNASQVNSQVQLARSPFVVEI